MNEQRVRAIVREELGLTKPHVHDLRWATLPYGSAYPYNSATVQCVAPACPWTAHQYVTIESKDDLPKYMGPVPPSWGPCRGAGGERAET